MESKEHKKIDLIEFRKQEIEYAILSSKQEVDTKKYKQAEAAKPWYQKTLTLNLFGAALSLMLIALVLSLAYFLG